MLNIASGFIVSLLVWTYIAAPIYNLPVNTQTNLGITSLFTVFSIFRSYFWRRFFVVGIHKRVVSLGLKTQKYITQHFKRSSNE